MNRNRPTLIAALAILVLAIALGTAGGLIAANDQAEGQAGNLQWVVVTTTPWSAETQATVAAFHERMWATNAAATPAPQEAQANPD